MTKYFTKDGEDFVEVSDELHTQSEVDSAIEVRLGRLKKQYADYDSLKEKADSVETIKKEYDDKLKAADTEKSTLAEELGKTKLEVEKVKIVNEFKLSDDLVEFVTGSDASEMRQRAEKLAKGIKGGAVNIDKKDKPASKDDNSKVIAGKLFGKKSDD